MLSINRCLANSFLLPGDRSKHSSGRAIRRRLAGVVAFLWLSGLLRGQLGDNSKSCSSLLSHLDSASRKCAVSTRSEWVGSRRFFVLRWCLGLSEVGGFRQLFSESEIDLPFALSHISIMLSEELEELCRSPERCFSNSVMVFIVEKLRCGYNKIGLRGFRRDGFAGVSQRWKSEERHPFQRAPRVRCQDISGSPNFLILWSWKRRYLVSIYEKEHTDLSIDLGWWELWWGSIVDQTSLLWWYDTPLWDSSCHELPICTPACMYWMLLGSLECVLESHWIEIMLKHNTSTFFAPVHKTWNHCSALLANSSRACSYRWG